MLSKAPFSLGLTLLQLHTSRSGAQSPLPLVLEGPLHPQH